MQQKNCDTLLQVMDKILKNIAQHAGMNRLEII
jgi:hypothetical protein